MPNSFHPLLKKNAVAIKNGLIDILDSASIDRIQREIDSNVTALFNLGLDHYHFAEGTDSSDWRHKKSRLYYAAYNVARSIRLHYDGVYSTDSEDHKKVGNLPNDFPNLAKYQNDLPILRDDRNKCDYDHVASEQDLFFGIDDTVTLVEEFIQDARDYLKTKGNIIL